MCVDSLKTSYRMAIEEQFLKHDKAFYYFCYSTASKLGNAGPVLPCHWVYTENIIVIFHCARIYSQVYLGSDGAFFGWCWSMTRQLSIRASLLLNAST